MQQNNSKLTSNHWGIGLVEVADGKIVSVKGHPSDPNPSEINKNIASSLNGNARISNPAVRVGWLNGTGTRGHDDYVEISWDQAYDLIAAELTRVRTNYGNDSIFAGSYGWSSAGRFHHAQSQLKRFLNAHGGFVRSEGNYSYNAALVLMPHIVGSFRDHVMQATRWPVIAQHSDLVVMFGGMATRNTQVSDGGVVKHRMMDNMKACRAAGVKFVNFSPLQRDADDTLDAEWLPPKPGTDVAIMMGLAHTLLVEGLHDQAFLDKYTVGFEKVATYLLGKSDGIAKSAEWAAEISGVSADRIRSLAIDMASSRTIVTCAAGVQRTDYGEQPLWMTVTLGAMLGQIGLPGGGFMCCYGVNANIGNIERLFRPGALSQGRNPVKNTIPVAMIAEMLLNPGRDYSYNGQTRTFPDAKMVWWAGGNPFHHHQDLLRLHKAFQSPQTIIVNELNWTSTARHADIVLPVAAPQERTDFGVGKSDNGLVPMPAHTAPPAAAKIEYNIYAELSRRLGNENAFTEGRSETDWLEKLWQETQSAANAHNIHLPDLEEFMSGDFISLPDPSPQQVFLSDFRADPNANPLPTPSGKIELFSQRISDFDLPDCPGHPTWFPMRDLATGQDKQHPLYLLSGQPETRLHSQLDNGDFSTSRKVKGREPVLIHPQDARVRGIADGDIVELFNDRGRCLAGAVLTEEIAQGCLFLWTGAWWDPDFDAEHMRDRHGNPNVLTHDLRTSSLTQSSAAHSALVDVAPFTQQPPEIQIHKKPCFKSLSRSDIQNKIQKKVEHD